jgi:hypothetical protein
MCKIADPDPLYLWEAGSASKLGAVQQRANIDPLRVVDFYKDFEK